MVSRAPRKQSFMKQDVNDSAYALERSCRIEIESEQSGAIDEPDVSTLVVLWEQKPEYGED